jgi:hypothetical protein
LFALELLAGLLLLGGMLVLELELGCVGGGSELLEEASSSELELTASQATWSGSSWQSVIKSSRLPSDFLKSASLLNSIICPSPQEDKKNRRAVNDSNAKQTLDFFIETPQMEDS